MDAEKYENLKELVEKFVDTKDVQRYIGDIQAGDQILREYPAPGPDDMLLANIKAEIALNILPRKVAQFRKTVYKAVAIAAAVIIISVISISLFEKQNNTEPVAQPRYEVASIFNSADFDLESIKAGIEQLRTNLAALETVTDDVDYSMDNIQDLEIQSAVLSSSDFWEG